MSVRYCAKYGNEIKKNVRQNTCLQGAYIPFRRRKVNKHRKSLKLFKKQTNKQLNKNQLSVYLIHGEFNKCQKKFICNILFYYYDSAIEKTIICFIELVELLENKSLTCII